MCITWDITFDTGWFIVFIHFNYIKDRKGRRKVSTSVRATVRSLATVSAYVHAKCSHHIRTNHLSMMQWAQLIHVQLRYDGHWMKWPYVWVSSLWIPHGDSAWQGRIYPWKQMGRKRRREPSSCESHAGPLLMVEWITDVWQCSMSECSTLSLIDHCYIENSGVNMTILAKTHLHAAQRRRGDIQRLECNVKRPESEDLFLR